MKPRGLLVGAVVAMSCGHADVRYPDREPYTRDSDLLPVAVPCRPDPSKSDADRVACFPVPYESPFAWDKIDNLAFERFSRGLHVDVSAEAVNVNALDETPDSAWFVDRPVSDRATLTRGGCGPDDLVTAAMAGEQWVVDDGKANGATVGFRIEIPGHGKYLLKADETLRPERASAASVIGSALYAALGFRATCEQVVYFKPEQLELEPGLTVTSNLGVTRPFDEAALKTVLASLPHRGALVRMEASRWLEQPLLGPFRYEGVRDDDPNDVIPHEDRRELRGSRILAAWLDHWDSREQNTLDVWVAANAAEPRSSPGHVEHFIIDTSDSFGQHAVPDTLERRLGWSYLVDWRDIAVDFVSLGFRVSPWDRATVNPAHALFGYFSARDFDPAAWKGAYSNPTFLRMTERDAAWMTRRIARLGPAELAALVDAGQLTAAADRDYLLAILVERQRRILARYLTVLSPLTDVAVESDGTLCMIDLARARGVYPPPAFAYRAEQVTAAGRAPLATTTKPDGRVCVMPPAAEPGAAVRIRIWNGTTAGPLDVYGYGRRAQPMHLVGLRRTAP